MLGGGSAITNDGLGEVGVAGEHAGGQPRVEDAGLESGGLVASVHALRVILTSAVVATDHEGMNRSPFQPHRDARECAAASALLHPYAFVAIYVAGCRADRLGRIPGALPLWHCGVGTRRARCS